jgi:polysaccharide pyruvyl transferase WcaK-like protein
MTSQRPPRVGLFGFLGLGNSGNEASMEAILAYLRGAHPDAAVDAMSGGFGRVHARYGIAAIPISWNESRGAGKEGIGGIPLKLLGKLIDVLRIILWVRKHDVVIVPGMGVLEATLPLRAYGFPFSMFVLSASGKLLGVKVALVSVGANLIKKRATRRLLDAAARLASYRSYRDVYSMDAMRQRGIDTSRDQVFPDLAFALPTPPYDPGDPRLVAVGVMDYYGGNDDRARAGELNSAYVEKMTCFVRWLLDKGYRIRFFGGDDMCDYTVAEQILANVRRPDHDGDQIIAAPFSSYAAMLGEMNRAGTVVATRFHNVLGAVKLCKPTIAIGYSQKFVPLMSSMGLAEFIQPAHELDVDKLIKQFEKAQSSRPELLAEMIKRNAENSADLARQFKFLSASLFSDTASQSRP